MAVDREARARTIAMEALRDEDGMFCFCKLIISFAPGRSFIFGFRPVFFIKLTSFNQ